MISSHEWTSFNMFQFGPWHRLNTMHFLHFAGAFFSDFSINCLSTSRVIFKRSKKPSGSLSVIFSSFLVKIQICLYAFYYTIDFIVLQIKNPAWLGGVFSAAGLGLEPRYSASKADVLPLDDPAMFFLVFYILLYFWSKIKFFKWQIFNNFDILLYN